MKKQAEHFVHLLGVMFRCWRCGTNFPPETFVENWGVCPGCHRQCIEDVEARTKAIKWAQGLLGD